MYSLKYNSRFNEAFSKLDQQVQQRVYKKTQKLKEEMPRRHLKHGLPYFVEEAGQNRIVYKLFENEKIIELLFVGNHKEYERFCNSFF